MLISKNDVLDLDEKIKFFNHLYDSKKQFSRGLHLKIEDNYDREVEREIGGGQNTLLTVQYFLEHKKLSWRILFYPKRDESLKPIKDSYFFTVVTGGGFDVSNNFKLDEDFKEEEFQRFSDAKNDVINKIIKTYEKFPA